MRPDGGKCDPKCEPRVGLDQKGSRGREWGAKGARESMPFSGSGGYDMRGYGVRGYARL